MKNYKNKLVLMLAILFAIVSFGANAMENEHKQKKEAPTEKNTQQPPETPSGRLRRLIRTPERPIADIQDAIQRGASVNEAGSDGDRPLHLAIKNNKPDVVKSLLQSKALLHKQGKDSLNALQLADKTPDRQSCVDILEAQIELDKNFLQQIADNRPIAEIQESINKGANPHMVNKEGESLLHTAAKNGRVDTVKLLLNNKAFAGSTTKDKKSVADYATPETRQEIEQLIAQYTKKAPATVAAPTASTSAVAQTTDMSKKEKDKPTVVDLTSLKAAEFCALLESREIPKQQLNLAVERLKPLERMQLGIRKSVAQQSTTVFTFVPKTNLTKKQQDTINQKLLDDIDKKETLEVIQNDLREGANPNATNEAGEISLHYAVRAQRSDILETLLQSKAHVNHQDKGQATSLFLATSGFINNPDLCRILLQHGANIALKSRGNVLDLKKRLSSVELEQQPPLYIQEYRKNLVQNIMPFCTVRDCATIVAAFLLHSKSNIDLLEDLNEAHAAQFDPIIIKNPFIEEHIKNLHNKSYK